MDFLELSIKSLENENEKLYELINKEYNYDCVIFVARGSYLIGKYLADKNNVPLIEIFAKRKGGKIKKLLRPFLQLIPNNFKRKLREKEFNSNIHEKKIDRNVYYDEKKWNAVKEKKNILIVDDSVDTGYTIKSVKEKVCEYFKDSQIKVAALNCFEKSKKIVTTDYYLYTDTMIKGPWSNDSKENKTYLKMYDEWKVGA